MIKESSDVTSSEDIPQNSICIAPNPTSDLITILGNENIEIIELYDISGRKIIETMNNGISLNSLGLCDGTYIIKVITKDKSSSTYRIIKKNN